MSDVKEKQSLVKVVFTPAEVKKLPSKIRGILESTNGKSPEVKAMLIHSITGVYVDSSEVLCKFKTLVSIIKSHILRYCPFCQKRISRKHLLGKKIEQIKNCECCKGKGSVTAVEIEKYQKEVMERRNNGRSNVKRRADVKS